MVICPTVTAYDAHTYREQIERVESFADRLHIDLMDGQFAPTASPPLDQIWLPAKPTDLHLMYKQPMNYLEALTALRPHMVIVHAEADGDHAHFATHLREHRIKAGLALLQATPVESVLELLPCFDHILIFSGDLGHHGGQADLTLLEKVRQIRKNNATIEIGWDGGVNNKNARQLVDAGVSVLNVGGFIQDAKDPAKVYADMLQGLNNS